VAALLTRARARYHLRVVTELQDIDFEERFKEIAPDLVLFADIGSGYMELIDKHLLQSSVVIMDHHPPSQTPPRNTLQVNPHDFGIDGATQVSSSGVAYFVARALSPANKDLTVPAIVGALGDMQDKNSERKLSGLNTQIVRDGEDAGFVKSEFDLILYGRETRPVHKALAYTTTPFLPGLSGEEDNCLALVTKAGISLKVGERWRTCSDLTKEEKQKLLGAIIEHLVARGFQGNLAMNLIGTTYSFPDEEPQTFLRDAREYATALNACGRMSKAGLGVGLCMGDRSEIVGEVQEVMVTYRKTLADYMRWIFETKDVITELNLLAAVRGEKTIAENMTGALSTILSSAGHLRPEKATVVIAQSSAGGFKFSARAPDTLLRRGVNLGTALHEVASGYSGFGGGHNVAAGAHIFDNRVDEFLEKLDALLQKQVNRN
jgi:RecJ-like exonuclease